MKVDTLIEQFRLVTMKPNLCVYDIIRKNHAKKREIV